MEKLLSKIYDKVVVYEKDSIELNKEYEQIIAEILEPLKERMTDLELEDIKERMYDISYQTERYGFMLGVRFMLGLLAECIQIKE